TINVTAQADTKNYDGNINSTIVPITAALASGDNITTQPTQSFDNKNVGTAKTLTASGLVINDGNNGDNYTINYVVNNSGIITKQTINVTAQADTKNYDGNINSTIVPITAALASGDNILTQPTQSFDNKNIGTSKTLTASGLVINDGNNGDNYTINYLASNNGVITKQTINVTAQADTKTYDGNTTSTIVPITATLASGDNITTQPTQSFDNRNIGTAKTLTASGLVINDGNNGDNYTINYVANNSGTITPALLIYTAALTSKVYGDANPILQGNLSGFVSGDTQLNSTSGTLVFNTTATVLSGIGNYNITGSGVTATNYLFQQATGNNSAFTITPRPISVIAESKTKIYGAIDPALTYRITSGNLVNNDLFTGSLTRTTGNNVNIYPINQGTLGLNNNYILGYQTADFTISKAVLNITANNAVRCFGNSNPTLSVNYNGFQYNDSPSSLTDRATVSTTANINSPAGNYNLIPSGAVSLNYSFIYTNGTLTINPLPIITISSDKGNSVSKGETTTLTATSSNGVAYSWANTSSVISGQNSATLKVRPLEPTTYTVTVTSAEGCQSTSNITIGVTEDYQGLKAENFITPNGDGQNDTWVVHNIDAYPNHNLTIVDRAGKVVYQIRNYKNDWEGTFQGAALQQGTYYYVFRFDKPGIVAKKGFITIVRQGQ
ncbi:MAG: gliding motility-associated C-terminal domain-containing protein, partial [Flavobacteriales bacterium]